MANLSSGGLRRNILDKWKAFQYFRTLSVNTHDIISSELDANNQNSKQHVLLTVPWLVFGPYADSTIHFSSRLLWFREGYYLLDTLPISTVTPKFPWYIPPTGCP